MSRKVWYVSSVEKDVSSADQFGKLYPIFDGRISRIDFSQMQRIIAEQVLPIASRDDAIILVGPTSMLMVLTAMWYKHFGICKTLIWTPSIKGYTEWFFDELHVPTIAQNIR